MAKKKEEPKLPEFLQELEDKYKYEELRPSYYEDLYFREYRNFTLDRIEVEHLTQFMYDALEAKVESAFKHEAYEIFKKMIDFQDWGDEAIELSNKHQKERETENKRREKLKKTQEAKAKAAAKKKMKAPSKK